MGFTTADIIITIIILFLALKGVIAGFTKEFFSTAGIVGGIFTASHFAGSVAKLIQSNLVQNSSYTTLRFIAFIAILAIVWWSISTIGKFIDNKSSYKISTVSMAGGYLVGALKYFIVISLILFVILQTPSIRAKNFGKSISSSKIYPLMTKCAVWLLNGDALTVKKSSNNNGKH